MWLFMDYFLDICKSKDFIIHHSKLKEYNVINNNNTSRVIIDCLNQSGLKENVDYSLVHNVVQQSKDARGTKHLKEYKLTPKAFKLCLMSAKNTNKYRLYYILLEEVFAYYTEYEKLYKDKLLFMKDDKIDKQSNKIDELLNETKLQRKDNKELFIFFYKKKIEFLFINI